MGPGRATWPGRTVGRRVAGWAAILVAVSAIVAGCAGGASRSGVAQGTDPRSGFPLGAFAKEFNDPSGRVRVVWTFEPDGRFAEVPQALDGQALDWPTVRGTWTADAQAVTIVASFPEAYGTMRHGWRVDGDRLWTFLIESDNPDDKEWFATLDVQPWRRLAP
jgi:hypothetical protein